MATVDLQWEWDLASGPADLWPWLADTDHFNRAAGLPPVAYAWERGPNGARRRVASSTLGPLAVRWIEAPFTWTAGQALGVRREFLSGPLLAYESRTALAPTPSGGSRVTHTLRAEPRSGIPAAAVRLVLGRLGKDFARGYRTLDDAARASASDREAGEPPADLLSALASQGVAPDLAARLAAHVAHAPDRQVEALRPHALADAWGRPRGELLAACLAGVRAGVLAPRWALRCPHCRGAKGAAASLTALAAEASCEDCEATFAGALDRDAELLFRPEPATRALNATIYCVAGPGATPHVVAQGTLAPGESRLLALALPGGTYRVRAGLAPVAEVAYDPGEPDSVAGPLDLAGTPTSAHVGGAALLLALRNGGPTPAPFLVAADTGGPAGCPVAVAIAHPDFARTCPDARLAPGRSYVADLLVVLAGAPQASGGFAAVTSSGQPVRGYYDAAEAIGAALAALAADPQGAIALEAGPVTLTGTDAGPPRLAGPLVTAVPGALTLGPQLAADAMSRFQLLMAGWEERWNPDTTEGSASFTPPTPAPS